MRHIHNIYKTQELNELATCVKIAQVRIEGSRQVMQRLIATHDAEKGKEHIEVHTWKNKSHDRWLIIDDTLYHCGHSLNAMGNHLSAISQMGINPEEILKQIK